MSLDPATVRRIATLARIRVEDAEIPALQAELNGILGWIEQLNEVNVDGVEPLTGAARMALKMRDDVVTDGGYPDKVLANAPERTGDFYAVPKVVGMSLTDLTIAAGPRRAAGARHSRAEELTLAHLHAIEALNPRLNAYLTVSHAQAVDQARAADAALARGEGRALTGIPLAIKDLFCTTGVRTTAGSRILGPFVPPYESTVTANLLRDGAVFLGKTNMDEFAMGSSNMTSAYGPVENPWKRRQDAEAVLVPGGSSGGSAAAVSARLAMGGTGTDTGGSIRQPASFCGIVGVKPTYGRCSRWGVVAFASSLDHPGPFARTVRDSAILLGSMAGHDPKDSTSADVPVPDYEAACGRGVKGLRIGVPREYRVGRHAGGDRGAVAARRGLAARRRRRDRGRLPAAHEIRPAHLLHRRAGGGVVQPGALRRRALRPAERRRGPARPVRAHARGRLRRGGAATGADRHLCAVGRLLRRLLPAGAEGAGADPARLHRCLRRRWMRC